MGNPLKYHARPSTGDRTSRTAIPVKTPRHISVWVARYPTHSDSDFFISAVPMRDILEPIQDICKNVRFPQFFPYGNDVVHRITTCLNLLSRVIGGSGYKSCVSHYLESSSEVATAAVEPGSVADLAEIVSTFTQAPSVAHYRLHM